MIIDRRALEDFAALTLGRHSSGKPAGEEAGAAFRMAVGSAANANAPAAIATAPAARISPAGP